MLKVGLGFNDPNQNPLKNTSSATADWANWDGTNDGTNTNIFTGGGTGAQDIAAVSDNEAVLLWDDSDNNAKVVVLDIDNNVIQPETTNTILTLANGTPFGMNIVRMSDTKFLCLYDDGSASGAVLSLITKSGKTLTETDVMAPVTGIAAGQFRMSLARLSDTKAVAAIRDGTDGEVLIVDITSDTISVGTPLSVGNFDDYPSVCRATDNAFWIANTDTPTLDSGIRYCTVSGTTITEEDRIDIDAASTQYDDKMLAYIDDDTCICAYEHQSTSTVDVNTFSWNGSNIVRGTAQTDIFNSSDIFQGTGTVTELPNRGAMFAGRQQDETPRQGAVTVCTVDESNNITVSSEVTIFPSIQADHTVIDVTPSGLYVFAACQDETTTPIQQIGTRVLQGF